MNTAESTDILKRVLTVYFNKTSINLGQEFTPNITGFLSLRYMFGQGHYFIEPVEGQSASFVVQRLPSYIFTVDERDESSRLYVQRGKRKISFDGSLYALLITEFALWLYRLKEVERLTIKCDFKKYPVLRQLGTMLFKEDDYPNKLWIDRDGHFITTVLGLEQELYVFLNNRNNLPHVSQAFGIAIVSKEERSDYQTDSFVNSSVNVNSISAHLYNAHLAISVPVKINAADDNLTFTDIFLERCKNFVMSFTQHDYLNLVNYVTKEITDSAYSQSQYNQSPDDYNSLKKDLQLKLIQFDPTDDSVIVEFNAPTIFHDNIIAVLLDFDKNIEDIEIRSF